MDARCFRAHNQLDRSSPYEIPFKNFIRFEDAIAFDLNAVPVNRQVHDKHADLLAQGLAARDDDERQLFEIVTGIDTVLPSESVNHAFDLKQRCLFAPLGILGVATGALQVATGEANEDRPMPRKGALALDCEEVRMNVKDVVILAL